MEAMLLGPATRQPQVFTSDVVDRFTEVFATDGALTPPLSYYRSMDVNWHAAADLPERIDRPALMVCAEHDPVLRPAMSEGMEDRISDLTRVLIEDCGHWTQQEQPDALNRALVDFCDRLPRWA
jgi:pimeloyl-ACP methyl ester carboxylesterase